MHTSVFDPTRLPATLDGTIIRASRLQRLRQLGVPLPLLAPLLPTAFARVDLRGTKVVISSTSAFAHHVRPPAGAVHLSYCHSPPHFLWERDEYFRGRSLRGLLLAPALDLARRSDLAAADRVDVFVANSQFTADELGMTILKPVARSPEKGAETLVWLATSPEAATVNGGYYFDKEHVLSSA